MAEIKLNYDVGTVAEMLAALTRCASVKRLDSLAALIKIFVENETVRTRGGES